MRILVTGASGFIGRRLMPRLGSLGHQGLALVRGPAAGEAPEDLTRIAEWRGWPGGIDVVVHLGALNPMRGEPARGDLGALMQANAQGTRALAERARREGVRRFVYVSSANVHASKGRAAVRESDVPAPQSPYGHSKLGGERALAEIAAASSMEAVILRPVPVYGPGGRNLTSRLASIARLPLALPRPSGTNLRSLLSIDNAVDAIIAALDHPAAAGQSFLVSDGPALSVLCVVAAMRRGLGKGPTCLPFALAGLERLVPSFVVDSSAIEGRLGWHPPETTEAALARWLSCGRNKDAMPGSAKERSS